MDNFGTRVFEKKMFNRERMKSILKKVYEAFEEKGYHPIDQIVGYVLFGDPAYITSYNNARSLIQEVERNELLGELLSFYLDYEQRWTHCPSFFY